MPEHSEPAFHVVEVPADAAESTEQLGTKPKFWFRDSNGRQCLFKEGRGGTGENWSEKVAAELSSLIGLPHADYDLAMWRDRRGTVSPSFVPKDGRLVLGNELLARIVTDYGNQSSYRQPEHTVGRVIAVMRNARIRPPAGYGNHVDQMTAHEVFLGYLLLDAWIGNTDRHHENWGLVLSADSTISLAPTFDHASSLGRNETGQRRSERLTTHDKRRSVEAYAARARSGLYRTPTDTQPMLCIDAFYEAARSNPAAARRWLAAIAAVDDRALRRVLNRLPAEFISDQAREFAYRMLVANRAELLRREQGLP